MLVTCSECSKKLNVAETLAGKKIRCPGCKTIVPVPSQQITIAPASAPKAVATEIAASPEPANKVAAVSPSSTMRCAACKVAALQPLPPNRFSRRPGYVCSACGKIMRPPGTTGLHVFVIFLGGFVFLAGLLGGVAILFVEGIRKPLITVVALAVVVGASTAVWAIKQLTLPIPLDAPARPIRIWVVLAVLTIIFVLLSVIGASCFGIMYVVHEM